MRPRTIPLVPVFNSRSGLRRYPYGGASICTGSGARRRFRAPGIGPGLLVLILVPGGQDPRPLGGDGDGELEVRGERAVLGVHRPAVIPHTHQRAAGVDHRLDRQHHALLELRPAARLTVVGDLRLLVHVAPDPVPNQAADDRKPVELYATLDRRRDVAEVVSGPDLRRALEERLARR